MVKSTLVQNFKHRIRQERERQAAERAMKRAAVPAPYTELSTVHSMEPGPTPNMALGIITTNLRQGDPVLAHTISSIRLAGFIQPIDVFAQVKRESDVSVDDLDTYVHCDTKGKGVYSNWKNAATYMLDNTAADWFMIMEDDIEWCRRGASILYYTINRISANVDGIRAHQIGVLSAYTSPAMVDNSQHATGWTEAQFAGATKGLWGALALCFPRKVLSYIVNHERFVNHKDLHAVDYLVGDILRKYTEPPLDVKIHIPSLVEHKGEISTIFSRQTLAAPGIDRLRHGYQYKFETPWRMKVRSI